MIKTKWHSGKDKTYGLSGRDKTIEDVRKIPGGGSGENRQNTKSF